MANRIRNKQIKFFTTEEEKEIILKKMDLIGIKNQGDYLRKMAIDGMIFKIDNTPLKEISVNISRLSSNINQIARISNSNGNIYADDIKDIKEIVNKIWQSQKYIISKLP